MYCELVYMGKDNVRNSNKVERTGDPVFDGEV
jgi:hypothetical protein